MKIKPWTFVPFEVQEEPTWAVYDDNLARIVARFHDEDEAAAYLKWRNKRQDKLRRKAAKEPAAAGSAPAKPARPLRERLVAAALGALVEGDPVIAIGVDDDEVRIGWW